MSYPKACERLESGQPVTEKDSLVDLNPLLGEDGIMRVGGRLSNSGLDYEARHPMILNRRSWLTKLLVDQLHQTSKHAGPSTMVSILAESYYIRGVKRLTKMVSHQCFTCKKAYARTAQQLMGQLPASRVTPASPFSVVGIDFAGPFDCKRGPQRKPVMVKTYACVFVCFTTKAVHLELVTDLSSEAFLAAFTRFVGRRGYPSDVHSDNGSNFRGAWREIKEVQDLLRREETQSAIRHFSSERAIKWHFSPSRSPHFGGLWEAAVKAMKIALRKIVGNCKLSFEELTTVLVEAEATLNSRPLLPIDSMPTDGAPVLTPGHFLVGRPLRSVPLTVDTDTNISHLRRWNLVRRIQAELWSHWKRDYLRELQKRTKWHSAKNNIVTGDMVLVKDGEFNRHNWPVGIIMKVFPGDDGLVRAVEVRIEGKVYSRPVAKLVLLMKKEEDSLPHPSGGEYVQASEEALQEGEKGRERKSKRLNRKQLDH